MASTSQSDIIKVFVFKGLEVPKTLDSIDSMLPLIELVRKDGSIFLFKVDGVRIPEKGEEPYTVMASNSKYEEAFFRMDCTDLLEGMRVVLIRYAEKIWNFKG